MSTLDLVCVLSPPLTALPEGLGKARSIVAADLQAVAAAPPAGGTQGLARDRLGRALLDHQRRLEALQPGRALLPAAFGTAFAGEEEIARFLAANAARLHALIAAYGRRREFRITVDCPVPQQVALAGRLTGVPSDGEDAAAALLRTRFRTRLAAAGRETIEMPVAQPETILNLVLLIEEGGEAGLDEALAAVDACAPDWLRLRCIGPLPACSFASLSRESVSAEAVEDAQAQLGISSRDDPAVLRRAFASHARRLHPDQGGDAEAFGRIQRSFALLRRVAQLGPAAPGDEPPPLLRVLRADRQPVVA